MINLKLTLESNNYFYYKNLTQIIFNKKDFISITAEDCYYNKIEFDDNDLSISSSRVYDKFLLDDNLTKARPIKMEFFYESRPSNKTS